MAITTGMYPLAYLCETWMEKIRIGERARWDRFGQYADESEKFFDGPLNHMWEQQRAKGPNGFLDQSAKSGMLPTFRISVNKLFEAVAIFGPALYHQNPTVAVNPVAYDPIPPEALGFAPDDPIYLTMFQEEAIEQSRKRACASVKQKYLNWLSRENDKRTQARRVITEAVVCGCGFFYTQMHAPHGSQIKLPRSQYLSWRDVVIDPDAEYWEDIQWIAIRHQEAVNQVERRFSLAPGTLKGHAQSSNSQATASARREARSGRTSEQSYDLIEYWEVYSKNGMGHRLKGVSEKVGGQSLDFDIMGDYSYVVVAKDIPFPLNLSNDFLAQLKPDQESQQAMFERCQWPIPYWYDSSGEGGWPISRMSFWERIKSVWPMPTFKPCMGELHFVNWALSFAADRIAQSCQSYVAIPKAANASLQKTLGNAQVPFNVIEVSDTLGISPDKLVAFIQAPPFSADVWNMISAVLELIDKRTGLTELAYGLTSRQMRSATEARTRDENIAVRPDDMAQSVENTMAQVSVREMQAARWFCTPQDVMPVVGPAGAYLWEQYIQTGDVDAVVRDFQYDIVAGSARRLNKEGKVAQLLEFAQPLLPVIQQFAMGGHVGPWNAFVADLARLMDLDPQPYLVQLPQAGPDPAAQAEAQAAQAELEQKVQQFQLDMQMAQQEHDQKMQFAAEEHDLKMAAKEQESDAKVDQMKEAAKAKPKGEYRAR